jgi:hypothetical protein
MRKFVGSTFHHRAVVLLLPCGAPTMPSTLLSARFTLASVVVVVLLLGNMLDGVLGARYARQRTGGGGVEVEGPPARSSWAGPTPHTAHVYAVDKQITLLYTSGFRTRDMEGFPLRSMSR